MRRYAGSVYPPAPSFEGWSVAGLAVAAGLAGWFFGWIEATVVAVAGIVVFALAVPFVFGRVRLGVERRLESDRVVAGESVGAKLEITNWGRTITTPTVVDELIDGTRRRVEIPAIVPSRSVIVPYQIKTSRRGVITVGPTIITKSDPLGLLEREVDQSGVSPLWVHPRTVHLSPLPLGFAKDLDGPTSDTSPTGDIAFHAVRRYEPGDSHRHVHWMSTAKMGELMVRQHVDTRRPQLTVVLDTSELIGDSFELGMEVAASIGAATLGAGHGATIVVGPKPVTRAGSGEPVSRFLDRMAVVEVLSAPLAASCRGALRQDPSASAMVIITGGVARDRLLPLVNPLRARIRPIVVRLWPDALTDTGRFRGMPLIDASSLDMFQRAWEGLAR